MQLVRATDKDSKRLSEFFARSRLPGVVDIQFQRRHNFFNQYRIQSDDFATYMLVNDDRIEAMVSVVFKPAYLNGHKELIGWATDLRVSSSRKAILNWSRRFFPVLLHERNRRNCKFLFSLLLEQQRQAHNALIRPRRPKRMLPRYFFFRQLRVVTLHGLLPFVRKPLSGIHLRYATSRDFSRLVEYIVKKRQNLPLHYSIETDDIRADIERWHGLGVKDFILAIDSDKNIIGCVAPWSSRHIQHIHLDNLSPHAKNVDNSLYLLSFLNITHPLTIKNEALKFRYLTHLFADNHDIFYSLLYHAWQVSRAREALVYAHFQNNLLTQPPMAFIHSNMPAVLYCVLDANEDMPPFLKPRLLNEPPELELAFW